MILSSGFVGLGEALAKKTQDLFRIEQGIKTPIGRPVNSSAFSFDFSGAINKLLQPIRQASDPRSAAGSQVILTAGNAASGIIAAGADRVMDLLRGGSKFPENPVAAPMLTNSAQASGMSGIGELLGALALNRPAAVASTQSAAEAVASDAAKATRNSVLLIGGAALVLAFLSVSKAR